MASVTENMLLVGAGFLVMASIFFILFNFVLSVEVPDAGDVLSPLSGQPAEPARPEPSGPGGYSFLWFALLGLAVVVVLIGAKLVFASYVVER